MYLSIFYLFSFFLSINILCKCYVYIVMFIKSKKKQKRTFLRIVLGEVERGIQNIIKVFLKYVRSSAESVCICSNFEEIKKLLTFMTT